MSGLTRNGAVEPTRETNLLDANEDREYYLFLFIRPQAGSGSAATQGSQWYDTLLTKLYSATVLSCCWLPILSVVMDENGMSTAIVPERRWHLSTLAGFSRRIIRTYNQS